MSATYDVLLSVTQTFLVEGITADSGGEARDIASTMWWTGEVDFNRPRETYLDDATIAYVYDEGGDDEGDI